MRVVLPFAFSLFLAFPKYGFTQAAFLVTETNQNDSVLEIVSENLDKNCAYNNSFQECETSIQKLLKHPEFSLIHNQFLLCQMLVSVSGVHPEVISISLEIVEQLLQADSTNDDYHDMKSVLLFRQDALEGINYAYQLRQHGTLSFLLQTYINQEIIFEDIKRLAVTSFEKEMNSNDSFSKVTNRLRQAIETLEKYGNETELNSFLNSVRSSPVWRENIRISVETVLARSRFNEHEASDGLFQHCQRSVLLLDEGESCQAVTKWLESRVDPNVLDNLGFRQLASNLVSTLNKLNPSKSGDAQKLLESYSRNTE